MVFVSQYKQPQVRRIWSVKDIFWLLSARMAGCLIPRTGARGVRGTILSTRHQPWQSSADSADHLLQTHKKMAAKAINYILLCSTIYFPSPDANQVLESKLSKWAFSQIPLKNTHLISGGLSMFLTAFMMTLTNRLGSLHLATHETHLKIETRKIQKFLTNKLRAF